MPLSVYLTIFSAVRLVGKIYIVMSDKVERKLRLAVVARLGGKKGSLSGAIEMAVKDWLKKKD